ncbi:MAG TPA: multicopper oxidase domain-containing protein [Terriglobales bacterium]|nr:multicopper oxidase domain-containing protein [Terriglobales bacterium]
MRKIYRILLPVLVCFAPLTMSAQSFRVQCPSSTITHPDPTHAGVNNSEPTYNGPTQFTAPTSSNYVAPPGTQGGFVTPVTGTVNGSVKCQQISGGDGLSTMADGNQIFMFSFGPLSGLADVAAGRASTQLPNVFNTEYPGCTTEANCASPLQRGDPATTDGAGSGASPWQGFPALTNSPASNPAFTWNGAVGQMPEIANLVNIENLVEGPVAAPSTAPGCPTATASASTVTAWTDTPLGVPVGGQVVIANGTAGGTTATPAGYAGTWTVSCVATGIGLAPDGFVEYAFQYSDNQSGLASDTAQGSAGTAATPPLIDGHVDPRQIMDIGVMNGNIPAPLSVIDEDDEFFLTLSNVGMIMRPDLFEQHTVHFHGYPNASSFYDGVPDASIAINIGASFTYYYLAPDAGTYFWHCHITPPEHLQMGMVGQIYVRPRQDRVPSGGDLYNYLGLQNGYTPSFTALGFTGNPDLRTECKPSVDILCSATMPALDTHVTRGAANTLCSGGPANTTPQYVYNDGDGSTCYDVVYPIQMHGFDPNFHFVGMTFNPELFVDMKDKYFLLNGRGYPDTVAPGPQATVTTDGQMHYSQPMPTIINIPAGGKASLRLVNLSVTEYHTLQSSGVPMHVVGWMAKLFRDQDGNNTEYWANSVTLGGGEANDVILDASDDGCSAYLGTGCAAKLYPAGSTFYLYSSNLDHLSNDAENFGGMMTEVHICNSVSGPDPSNPSLHADTYGNVCN